MATCVRAHCPLDLNAAPGAVRVVFFTSVRRGSIDSGEWIVVVWWCSVPPGSRLFLAVGFAGFWIYILFYSKRKKRKLHVCS